MNHSLHFIPIHFIPIHFIPHLFSDPIDLNLLVNIRLSPSDHIQVAGNLEMDVTNLEMMSEG